MSWNFSGIITDYPLPLAERDFLFLLTDQAYTYTREISLSEATTSRLAGFAVGRVGDQTLILHPDLLIDCFVPEFRPTPLEKRLEKLAQSQDMLIWFLDGRADQYFAARYQDGKRMSLPAPNEREDQYAVEQIFTFLQQQLGEDLRVLMADSEIRLREFCQASGPA